MTPDDHDPDGAALFLRTVGPVQPVRPDRAHRLPRPPGRLPRLTGVTGATPSTLSTPSIPWATEPEPHGLAPVTVGSMAGIDARTARRLRRGRIPVEATLDLHGYSQAMAEPALQHFIWNAAAAGRRCVLVITGKGSLRGDGVLRRMTPLWLSRPPCAGRVLAIATGQPKDGGAGSYYVLVRRNR